MTSHREMYRGGGGAPRSWSALGSLAALIALAGCSTDLVQNAPAPTPIPVSNTPTSSTNPAQNRVAGGSQPIVHSSVQLYSAGTGGPGSVAVPLLPAPVLTDQSGVFAIAGLYTCPSPDAQVYLVATGGTSKLTPGTTNSAISLMAALGSCGSLSASNFVTIDEISTVAAIWPSAPYMTSLSQIGNADVRSVSNAFLESANLQGIVSGAPNYPGVALADQDLAIRSLADALSLCVDSNGSTTPGSSCGQLFALATPPGGAAPTDTAMAALNIARNPLLNTAAIYGFATTTAPFQPILTSPPADWTLGLTQPAPVQLAARINGSTVFMGDSITAWWPLPTHNAGIPSQHSADMLARFSSQVIGHGYARVVILAGTNDVIFTTPTSGQAIQQIAGMAQMAKAAGIEVVLCELPPIETTPFYETLVVPFNASIQELAISGGYLLVDYHAPMAGHPEYFLDGVHPNAAGYAVMEAALASVVRQ